MKIRKFLSLWKFLASGGFGAVVWFIIFYRIIKYDELWYGYSFIIAFLPSEIVSFICKKIWVFEDKDIRKIGIQFFLYIGLALIYSIVNFTFLLIAVELLHFELYFN